MLFLKYQNIFAQKPRKQYIFIGKITYKSQRHMALQVMMAALNYGFDILRVLRKSNVGLVFTVGAIII